jgi:hypothetical protein
LGSRAADLLIQGCWKRKLERMSIYSYLRCTVLIIVIHYSISYNLSPKTNIISTRRSILRKFGTQITPIVGAAIIAGQITPSYAADISPTTTPTTTPTTKKWISGKSAEPIKEGKTILPSLITT